MSNITEEILNKKGFFYVGEPQVRNNFTNGKGVFLKARWELNNYVLTAKIFDKTVQLFYGYINTEDELDTILKTLKLEKYNN